MNEGGVIQSASASVEELFGWTPMELYGRNIKELVPEPRRSALDRYLDRYRKSDRPKLQHLSRRFEAVRKDGTALHIELSMSRADLPPHAPPYFIGIIRDVSANIETEADSADHRSKLQMLITEQTRALATANLRLHLADRLAALGTLTVRLGHDMNNVLLPVRARMNALEHSGINAAARGHPSAIRRSVSYLQHLSDGLHFLAVDPNGPGVSDDGEGTTELAQWWGQVGGLLCKAVPKHVTLTVSFPARLPAVNIAPHWLTQAILNLIVNAGESIPEGRRQARVSLSARTADDGRTVRLTVADNGRGMTHAIQRRALDLFFTTKPRSMGTGLGLPLARKVAIRAGGDLELHSEPRRGTTVVLVLPVAVRRVAKSSAALPATRSAVVAVRNHRTSTLLSQILLEAGFQVRPHAKLGPGSANLWITDPTAKALVIAARWRKGMAGRALVLLGAPPKRTHSKWAEIGATIIDPPDDFEAMRHVLSEAARHETQVKPRKAHK